MVHQAVDRGHGHGWVGEDLVPLAERLIAGGDQAAALVALGDELEQDVGFGLVLAHVAEVVEDEHVEAVELCQGSGEREIAPCRLELLDEIGCSVKSTRLPVSTRAAPKAAARCVLPVPLGPKIRRLPPCSIQASPSASAITCALRMVGTAAKSRVAKVLPCGRPDSAIWRAMRGVALGEFVVAYRGEKAGAAPALAVGAGAKVLPDATDRRQAQRVSMTGSLAASTSLTRHLPGSHPQQFVIGSEIGRRDHHRGCGGEDRRGHGRARCFEIGVAPASSTAAR